VVRAGHDLAVGTIDGTTRVAEQQRRARTDTTGKGEGPPLSLNSPFTVFLVTNNPLWPRSAGGGSRWAAEPHAKFILLMLARTDIFRRVIVCCVRYDAVSVLGFGDGIYLGSMCSVYIFFFIENSYKKKQWRPPKKKKKRGNNPSPRNRKACHSFSNALLQSVAEIGTRSTMKSSRKTLYEM
jgi:hypothetical protein